MKMKWHKPTTKTEVKKAIQLTLVLASMTLGFSTVYIRVLSLVGFMMKWWTPAIAVICGGLSTFGLFHWIGDTL